MPKIIQLDRHDARRRLNGAEDKPAHKRLLNDRRKENRHGQHDILVIGNERTDRFVIVDRKAGSQPDARTARQFWCGSCFTTRPRG